MAAASFSGPTGSDGDVGRSTVPSADPSRGGEAGQDCSGMTEEVSPDSPLRMRGASPEADTARGMWLTASTWLPAGLLRTLRDGWDEERSGDGEDCRGREDCKDGEHGGRDDRGAPRVAAAFGQGGPLDAMPPGPALAAFLAEAAGPPSAVPPAAEAGPATGLAGCTDAELIGLIRGWRRQASLAAAGELAAVAELAARREAEAKAAGEWNATAFSAADDEIAAALTLTSRSAGILTDRAAALRALPATFEALTAGRIDLPRALVITTGLAGQPPALARAIEAKLIGRAPEQTTGQLRAALNRDLLAANPEAADRRRRAEEDQAFVERSPETGGVTASLAGRHLPVTATVAAWNRITDLARQLKATGTPASLDQLRVHVFLALLTGQALAPPALAVTDYVRAPDSGTADAANYGATDAADCSTADAANYGTTDAADCSTAGAADDGGAGSPRGGAAYAAAGGIADAAAATVRLHRPTATAISHADEAHGPSQCAEQPAPRPADASARLAAPAPTASTGTIDDRPTASAAEATGGTAAPAPTGPADATNTTAPAPTGPADATGRVNLTIPLTTLLGLSGSPGELGGFGPITAHTAREIAIGALNSPVIRWCVTVTGDTGQPVGHGCATRSRTRGRDPDQKPRSSAAPANESPTFLASGNPGWALAMKITALAGTECGHERESASYRPPPALRHLIQVRNPRCTAPGCRMPAVRCDDDHTIPFSQGGRSCECNIGPLCRHHHRVKHSQGWRLEQPEPGVFAWVTPAGWTYLTGPENHAA